MFKTAKVFQNLSNVVRNKTNVRKMTKILKTQFIRSKFQILSKISPTLAAQEAMQLFFKTYRYQRPDREHKLLAAAKEKITIDCNGKKLAAWIWGSGPTVLLVHGWNGRGAQLGSFITPLVEAGFRVVAYDAIGHGDSPGQHASLVELGQAVAAAIDQLGPITGIIAHSLGTSATTLALAEGKKVSWLIYLAPPFQPRDYVYKFAGFLGVSKNITSLMEQEMSKQTKRSWESLDLPNLTRLLETPLLIIHDKEDKDVVLSEGAALANTWSGAELIVTKGLGHRRILHQSEVIEQVLTFIEFGQKTLSTLTKSETSSNFSNKISASIFSSSYKCSQAGCKNLAIETWDKKGQFCSTCITNAELFEPGLRWA